ncbi:MAG: hypothetical protein QM775_31135 [Pirellulales bacterium]
MKRLFFWLRKKRYFPRWFTEFTEGDLRAVIGQNMANNGSIELVVRFQLRKDWKYVDIGTVRYLDWPHLQRLNSHVDSYVQSLMSHG